MVLKLWFEAVPSAERPEGKWFMKEIMGLYEVVVWRRWEDARGVL